MPVPRALPATPRSGPQFEPSFGAGLSNTETPSVRIPQPGMRAIGSASVESLTSESLQDLRDMIVAARRQRREVDEDSSVQRGAPIY